MMNFTFEIALAAGNASVAAYNKNKNGNSTVSRYRYDHKWQEKDEVRPVSVVISNFRTSQIKSKIFLRVFQLSI